MFKINISVSTVYFLMRRICKYITQKPAVDDSKTGNIWINIWIIKIYFGFPQTTDTLSNITHLQGIHDIYYSDVKILILTSLSSFILSKMVYSQIKFGDKDPYWFWEQNVQMNLITASRGSNVPTTKPTFIEWQSTIHRSPQPPKMLGQNH